MKQTSLQGDLGKWLLIIVAVFGVTGSLISAAVAYDEAKELQDDFLKQIGTWLRAGHTIETRALLHDFDDEDIIIQPLAAERPLRLPKDLKAGFNNVHRHDRWRVLVVKHRGERYAIAQQTELREELAFNSAMSSALPMLLLSLALYVGLHIIIRRQLRPVNQLAREVNDRDSNDLTLLKTDQVPQEIKPFIDAINQLLVRVEQSVARQKRFIADAAHELRTPIAGLGLLAESFSDSQQREAQLLQKGLNRLQTLVAQLLNLARLQADTPQQEKRVAANEILQEVVISLHPLADSKNQDLGVTRNDAIQIIDRDESLWQIFQNSISNAIRYTPEGGSINIALFEENKSLVFQVEDSGPGIPAETLATVFEPFHRGRSHANESNGLGLAICKQIAERNNASIVLENRDEGGARFVYREPLS